MPPPSEEPELFSARRLFSGWPRPGVTCPICESGAMTLVAVRLCRDPSATELGTTGVHVTTKLGPDARLVLTFRWLHHESVLLIAPDGGGRLVATVESRTTAPEQRPLLSEQPDPSRRPQRPARPSRWLRLIRGRRERDRQDNRGE